jgi:regulator of replication initiation timing
MRNLTILCLAIIVTICYCFSSINKKHLESIDVLSSNIQKLKLQTKTLNSNLQASTNSIKKLNLQNQKLRKYFIKKQKNIFIAERKKDILFLSRIKLEQQVLNSFYHIHKVNKKNIYKEIIYFNTKGREIYKKSSIFLLKTNVSKNKYFSKIKKLQEGQIYISGAEKYRNNLVIRIITPIFRKFKKVGYLMGVVDYAFLQEIKEVKNEIKK